MREKGESYYDRINRIRSRCCSCYRYWSRYWYRLGHVQGLSLIHIFGKVQKVVSNINAAFIDIGPGCTGYYSLQERWKPERLKTGDELVVQVSKDAVKSKAPVVTERLSFTGRYCVLTVGKTGIGFSAKIRDASYKARLRGLLESDLAGTKDLGRCV